jgi:hypothetical protein
MTDDGVAAALYRAIGDRARRSDALLLASVPAVLVGVFALPPATRESLVFEYAAPSLRTAFLAPFVHLDRVHLLVNLAGYALVVPIAYLLSLLSGHRRRFRVVLVSLVLACPALLSYLNLAVARDGVSVGFSGPLMALYGYLPLALAEYLEARFGIGPSRESAPVLFFLGTALIAGLTFRSVVANRVAVPIAGKTVPVTPVLAAALVGLVAATLLAALLFGASVADRRPDLLAEFRAAVDVPGDFEVLAVGGFLFLAVPFVTFPADPFRAGGVVNLYVHLVGYALGFIASYASVRVAAWLFGPAEL